MLKKFGGNLTHNRMEIGVVCQCIILNNVNILIKNKHAVPLLHLKKCHLFLILHTTWNSKAFAQWPVTHLSTSEKIKYANRMGKVYATC